MAPINEPSVLRASANVMPLPASKSDWCREIHSDAAPLLYGCGMASVVSAMDRSPANRCTSGLSSGLKGRRTNRLVFKLGMCFKGFQQLLDRLYHFPELK